MIDSRAAFGCTINIKANEIYVAGGYSKGTTINKCEKYNIIKDEWT